jgi:hypothetical protein
MSAGVSLLIERAGEDRLGMGASVALLGGVVLFLVSLVATRSVTVGGPAGSESHSSSALRQSSSACWWPRLRSRRSLLPAGSQSLSRRWCSRRGCCSPSRNHPLNVTWTWDQVRAWRLWQQHLDR